MTQTFLGQHGSPDAGTPLPQPDDIHHHLAVLLGMLAGDKYRQPQAPPEGVNTEDLVKLGEGGMPDKTQDQAAFGFKGTGVLDAARKYLGVDYVYGGNDPKHGLDCSSFVQRSFADIGVMLPRVTYDQVNSGHEVASQDDLQPGDLLFFWGDGNRRDGHVGIYMGNGTMIDAPHTGAKVRYDQVNWKRVTHMRRVA